MNKCLIIPKLRKCHLSLILNPSAFTMIELLIVMAIISIMAAFAIPSFTKATKRSKARDAMNSLTIIHSANALYKANSGHTYYATTIADINTGMGLNIAAGDTAYVCSNSNPPSTCVATAAGGAADFQATVTLANPVVPGTNPSCSTTSGGCP